MSPLDLGQVVKPSLTPRQCQILEWAARGKANNDIAVIVGISPHTVDFHMRRIMTRLSANNRMVAVVSALAHGLIQP